MTTENTALALPDEGQFKREMEAINRFQKIVHANMVKDQDYGVIPGTQKPTLLKPGAEKISKLLGLADQYEIIDKAEDWQKPFFRYLIKCQLVHLASQNVVSEGLGECNSMEGKYRWRESKRKCPECGTEAIIKGKEEYGGGWLCFKKQGGCGAKFEAGDQAIEGQKIGRVENDDIYSQVNTIIKMAKKRALVDAALSAGRLSNVFTQDLEDLVENEHPPAPTVSPSGEGSRVDEKKAPDKKEGEGKSDDWGLTMKLAAAMGIKGTAGMCKALKVDKLPAWKETQEIARDTMEQWARANGSFPQGVKSWREIQV